MSSPVQHFELMSRDYKKAQEFYKDIFGWQIEEPPGMEYALIQPAGENSIGGGIVPVPEGRQPSVTFYITVDDIESYLKKIETGGGKTVVPKTPIADFGEFALFADLDGNVVGLYHQLKEA